jgi:hypothetical protein
MKPTPYHCPVCPSSEFYGKLLFDGDEVLPACPNHGKDEAGNDIVIFLVSSPRSLARPPRSMRVICAEMLGQPVSTLAEGWCPGHARG